jgi:phosphate transport system ATP-binding protein
MTTPTQPATIPPSATEAAAASTLPLTQPIKDLKRVQAFLKKTGLSPDEAAGLAVLRPATRTTRARRSRGGVGSAGQVTSVLSAPPRSLATLEAREVTAWFGDHKVLDRVSLTMQAGQVTSLIGPSGCGKSTFLRTLNRMHEQVRSARFAGSVLLDGRDIYDHGTKVTQARTHIGMVFQRPNPFPAMSIYDNVVSGLKLEGIRVSRGEKDDLVEKNLLRAGLWKEVRDRLAEPGGSLSGGQQQRLCIARALAVDPRVLLMDEPCSALDPTSTRVIEETMKELQKEVTIVIVTHNMQQAQRVSQQCAFFLASQGTPGAIVEYGDTETMFGAPQDERTRDYVNGRFG